MSVSSRGRPVPSSSSAPCRVTVPLGCGSDWWCQRRSINQPLRLRLSGNCTGALASGERFRADSSSGHAPMPGFLAVSGEGDRRRAELAHKSSDGAEARDGSVTVSGSDFGVFRPFPRERPSAKSLSLGETRLTGGAVALGSWRFESSRPSSPSSVRRSSIPLGGVGGFARRIGQLGSKPRRLLRLFEPVSAFSAGVQEAQRMSRSGQRKPGRTFPHRPARRPVPRSK